MDEFDLIRRFFDRAATPANVVVGIGDDGAVLKPAAGHDQVIVIDTLVEGVHFPKHFNPTDIGYRVVAVNLSDIAAMGATPRWMTLALSMPSANEEWLTAFAEGLHMAAAEHSVTLVGGDTTSAPQVVATVQVSGDVPAGQALLRSGANAGETIYVTGTVGDAAAGLDGLLHGRPVKSLVNRFARPTARVVYGQKLRGIATSAIDVSDGLYGDLKKLSFASGVGAEIDLTRLPVSDALSENYAPERVLSLALSGGDDYELLFTSSRPLPDPGVMQVTAIGTVTESRELVLRRGDEIVPYDDSGYRHFQ